MFFYEKWDVFKAAVRMREIAQELSQYQTPQTASDLDQLRRSASSCPLNIGEGARERTPKKKLDRYGTSRASAGEFNACLIILEPNLPRRGQPLIVEGKEVADRTSAMLTNLMRSTQRRADDDKNGTSA